jgi:hypothetical protein
MLPLEFKYLVSLNILRRALDLLPRKLTLTSFFHMHISFLDDISDIKHWRQQPPFYFCNFYLFFKAALYVAGTSKTKSLSKWNKTGNVLEKWEFYIFITRVYYNILAVHRSLSSLLRLVSWYDWFVTLHRRSQHCVQRWIKVLLCVLDLILLNQVLRSEQWKQK